MVRLTGASYSDVAHNSAGTSGDPLTEPRWGMPRVRRTARRNAPAAPPVVRALASARAAQPAPARTYLGPEVNDEDLVAWARQGDDDALARLLQKYRGFARV